MARSVKSSNKSSILAKTIGDGTAVQLSLVVPIVLAVAGGAFAVGQGVGRPPVEPSALVQTPSDNDAKEPRKGTHYLIETEAWEDFGFRLTAEVGALDSIDGPKQWHTKYFFADHAKPYWKANPTFTRFIDILEQPPTELYPHLSTQERTRILRLLDGERSDEKPFVAVLPEKTQYSLVILSIEGDLTSCSLETNGKDPWIRELIRKSANPIVVPTQNGRYHVCAMVHDAVTIRLGGRDLVIKLTDVWNPISRRRSPDHGRDVVRLDWSWKG